MHLPNEVLLGILESMSGQNLKNARLVSKSWCQLASVYAFQNLHVSSTKDDLEAFEMVAQNPILSTCVKHLTYDATEFLYQLSKRDYIRKLAHEGQYKYSPTIRIPWTTTDPNVNDWVNLAIWSQLPQEAMMQKAKHSKLITDGYRNYTRHAKYQHTILQSGQFLDRLTAGLSKLKALKSVAVDTMWMPRRWIKEERCVGSYLARHWHRFHLEPEAWHWTKPAWVDDWNLNHSVEVPDGMLSYQIITTALVQANCTITSFKVGADWQEKGVPPPAFNVESSSTPTKAIGMDVTAFASLQRLDLRLASCGEEDEGPSAPELCSEIAGLPILLGSLNQLKYLELQLSFDRSRSRSTFYSLDQAFPTDCTWPQLENLTLTNVSTTATEFLRFLFYQTPCLNYLSIAGVNLRQGSWEAFIEGLARSKMLTYLSYNGEPDGRIFQNGDELPDEDPEELFNCFEDYLAEGGRHPCLETGQPDSAAGKYLEEFDHALRERIAQLGEINAAAAEDGEGVSDTGSES